MPCMCGDTNCPSCGPAQGCEPEAPPKRKYVRSAPISPPRERSLLIRLTALERERLDKLAAENQVSRTAWIVQRAITIPWAFAHESDL